MCSNEYRRRHLAVHQRAWLTRNPDGEYVPNEKRAIQADPTIVDDFTPYLSRACKIVGASSRFRTARSAARRRCRRRCGAQATAVRSQSYYLDITPPGQNKGTFVQAMAQRLGISTDAVATIGDMHNDVAMFEVSGLSFAMGNASDEVKKHARRVTAERGRRLCQGDGVILSEMRRNRRHLAIGVGACACRGPTAGSWIS